MPIGWCFFYVARGISDPCLAHFPRAVAMEKMRQIAKCTHWEVGSALSYALVDGEAALGLWACQTIARHHGGNSLILLVRTAT